MNETKKKFSSVPMLICGIVLVIVAVVLIVWFLLKGEQKVSGGYPDPVSSVALSCESSSTEYPLFKYENVIQKKMKIDAVFNDNKLSSISLKHELTYNNDNNATAGETINHSAMNISFTNAGMSIDTLKSNYSVIDNVFMMTLYGRDSDVTDATKKYLMIDGAIGDIDSLSRQYAALGLKCVEKNN